MASLDLFIVNVAFGDIGREFRSSSVVNLSWVLNAYAILYAALLVPLGRLADRLGQRTVFLAGLASFTAGSAACAVSDNLWVLVAFRGMQAVGAAALTPASLGLLVATMPADRRDRAVRIWAATGALAAAVGPVVGGLLVEASWRWIFLVNVPIGLVALLGAHWSIPDTRHNTTAEWPDFLGGGVLLMSIGTLSLALVKAPAWGWGSPAVMTCFGSAALGVAVFWRRSLHHPSPVVEPDLLRVPTFA
jgi:MFS family permease